MTSPPTSIPAETGTMETTIRPAAPIAADRSASRHRGHQDQAPRDGHENGPEAVIGEGSHHPFLNLLTTKGGWASFVLRLALAAVIFPHGAQKALGWFGGFGFEGTMQFFTETMGIPYVFGLLAIVTEFVGPFALVTGFATRIAAFGIGAVMAVAAVTVHVPNGFFMDWFGTMQGEGYEFFILAVGMAAALVIGGGGRFSVDRQLTTRSGA